MSEKLAPSISDAHFEKMMALKPANARKHTFAGQLLMEAIDREYAYQASGRFDRLRDDPANSP